MRYDPPMITEVRLQNFKSFGTLQAAPLEAITVLVGANNSGKSNFLSFVDVVRGEGGVSASDFHRPATGDGSLRVEWDACVRLSPAEAQPRKASWTLRAQPAGGWTERVAVDGAEALKNVWPGKPGSADIDGTMLSPERSLAAYAVTRRHESKSMHAVRQLILPALSARVVHLSVTSLRQRSFTQQSVDLAEDGSNLAAVVAGWRMEFPERMAQFDEIIQKCLPEMSQVLAQPAENGQVRLLFKQRDGERFDSPQVSDGVLVFAGLVAHALSAPEGALVLIEEPERGIHPRRLADFVDLLRTLVRERRTQFIMASHSPALLNLFRDEPDSVLLLHRAADGTKIRRLSDAEDLAESLSRADPGELLANGAFNEAANF